MPFINIKVTGGAEAPTAEQKEELIKGATELLQRVLNKNPSFAPPYKRSMCVNVICIDD